MHAKSAMVEEKSDGLVNGIDLGTTYSRVDIFKNGHVEFTPIDQSNRITPSHVAFTKQEHLIGEPAKNQAIINPSQTLFDVTRLIDWRFKVPTAQTDVKLMPFKTVDKEINHAVATAPAHYNDAQRQPTKDAGTTSGMVITYTEIANETKSMLVKAGWNKDFFVNTTPVKPSLGWMGNLLKKSGNMVCGVGFKNSQR